METISKSRVSKSNGDDAQLDFNFVYSNVFDRGTPITVNRFVQPILHLFAYLRSVQGELLQRKPFGHELH